MRLKPTAHLADGYPACPINAWMPHADTGTRMYIVAIAWLYVVVLMALTESSFIAGLSVLIFYGLFPLSILLWIMGTPQRRRNRRAREASEQPDTASSDAQSRQQPDQ